MKTVFGKNTVTPCGKLDVISEQLKDALRLLPGVAKSEQYGVIEEAIYVETDLGTWAQLKLTASQLQLIG